MNCKVPVYLAYVMAGYTIASMFYLMFTKNIGTPLKDSYTKEQLEIKKKSAKTRKDIFIKSAILAAVILYSVKPFDNCLEN